VIVIKGQGREATDGPPAGSSGITAGCDLWSGPGGYDRKIGDADDVSPRVSTGSPKGVELGQVEALDPGLLAEFACRCAHWIFSDINEAAREGPLALKGWIAPLNEEDRYVSVP
jgi:hypothetical protein